MKAMHWLMTAMALSLATAGCARNDDEVRPEEEPFEPRTIEREPIERPEERGALAPDEEPAWQQEPEFGEEISPTPGPEEEQAVIQVQEHPELGRYLTDSRGRAVYLFLADEQGANRSACHGPCATAWPPVLTEGAPVAGEGARERLLGTIQRADGQTQVTYNGWPLYYYIQDQAAGDVKGQGVVGFGAPWYVVAPNGEAIREDVSLR